MQAVDVSTLPIPAQKILDPKGPPPLRQMAAKGIAPGLKPNDALTVLVLLMDDEAVGTVARATVDALPVPLLNGALGAELHPAILHAIAPRYAKQPEIMEKILRQQSIDLETVAHIAGIANEPVSELIAVNEERLLKHPPIIERLYMNKATRMSTADRVLELAVRNKIELPGIPAYKEAAAAIANELIAEPSEEPTPDDLAFREVEEIAEQTPIDPEAEDVVKLDEETGEEVVDQKCLPLHAQLANLSLSQKIRRAMIGTASERLLLVRDRNKLVAAAAVRSPAIQENEVVRISASRNVSEEVLRILATDGQWTKSHQVKLNLVANPRCPFIFASKLIQHLREHELKALAKSKNVTGAVSTAAKQQLQRRAPRGSS